MPIIGTGGKVEPGVRVRVLSQAAIQPVGNATRGVPTASSAAATVNTGIVGNNNSITWTAVDAGTPGNSIQVALVNPGTALATLGVVVTPTLITVNLATDGSSAISSTAAQVIAAVQANAAAASLVTVANNSTSTGAGIVTAVSATNLATGTDGGTNPTSAEFNRLVALVNNLRNTQAALKTALTSSGATA